MDSRRIVAAAALALCAFGPGVDQAAAATRTVTVAIDAGQGQVGSSPAGITCPTTCSASFDTTQAVTLTATPAQGFRVESWISPTGCSIQPTCVAGASTFAQTVHVTFRPAGTIVLVPNGGGTIAVSPGGIDLATGTTLDRCTRAQAQENNGACKLAYVPGTPVAFAALQDAGSEFKGFSDYRCPLPTCSFQIAAGEHALTASFSPLLLRIRGNGGGRVLSAPAGIDCRPDDSEVGCSAAYPYRQQVTLTAAGDAGAAVEWIAGCAPAGGNKNAPTCVVEVGSDPTWVVLRFGSADPPGIPSRVTVSLAVALEGGQGRVRGAKIDCGGTCEASYSFGDRERLVAEPAAGFRFREWAGGCGETASCEFPVGPITSVQAVFGPAIPVLQARLLRASASGRARGRRLSARVSVNRNATLILRLEKLSGGLLASRARTLRPGQTTTLLAVPRRVRSGQYRLVVLVRAGDKRQRFAKVVRVGRP